MAVVPVERLEDHRAPTPLDRVIEQLYEIRAAAALASRHTDSTHVVEIQERAEDSLRALGEDLDDA
jgi:hypothetical protein